MSRVLRRTKALSVSPLKTSATTGAIAAFLGLDRSLPLLHGSQGCSAFAKVFLIRHYREPIPLQSTAVDQVAAVMGADANLQEALANVCAKADPAVIGLISTGLTETEGCDLPRVLKEFRAAQPEADGVAIVPVNAPDYAGGFQSGYAAAVTAMIGHAPIEPRRNGEAAKQVNLLPGPALTPGDVEALKELVELFGLEPLAVPDLSRSLDGHLAALEFSPVTTDGTPYTALGSLGEAALTVVVGESLYGAADALRARSGVPDWRCGSLMSMDAVDGLILQLARISGRPVPGRLERQRARLQDAMLDSHFILTQSRVALAGDPDFLTGFAALLGGMGAEVTVAVSSEYARSLEGLPAHTVKVGDLEDLEDLVRANGADLLVGSAHAAATAERLGIPLLRAGWPQYDRLGGFQRTWIGYDGCRQALFDLANALLDREQAEVAPYRSRFQTEETPFQDSTGVRKQATQVG